MGTVVEKFFFPYDRREDDQFIEDNLNEPIACEMDPYYPNSLGMKEAKAFELLYSPDNVKEDLANKGG